MRIRGYAPATPCWVELASVDPAATGTFYAELLDWKRDGSRFLLRDFAVAGVRQLTARQPAGWLLHLSCDDLDATLSKVVAAGGTVRTPPATIGTDGRRATIADPCGAVLAVWQRAGFRGAELTGEPGTLCWSELCTTDAVVAADFYGRCFDWLLRGGPAADSRHGEWLTAARDSVAGLAPGHGTASWRVTFQVPDCAATAAACARLGGTVSVGPVPTDAGHYAELVDPAGAGFAVLTPHRRDGCGADGHENRWPG